MTYPMTSTISDLVTTDWLAERLNAPGLRVIDCRWVLGQLGEGRRQYDLGHIPRAAHLDVDEHLSGKKEKGPGRHPIPGRRFFQDLLSSLGIGRDTHVIAYDAGAALPATRLWWLLKYYGHDLVSVLDGGWQAWTQENRPISQEVPTFYEEKFEGRPRKKMAVDKVQVDSIRDEAETLLIDARSPERYRGETEPFDARPGHIPGAENFPCAQTIDPDTGKFLPPETLKALFQKIGVSKTKNIICYCGSGITACTNIFALKLAGHEAQLYEGSWSDWSADANLPATVGKS